MVEATLKPFLRWAGSKRQILPTLSNFWSKNFRRYVEPFAGSASLFFYIYPNQAQLSDANEELIELYKQVQSNFEDVVSALGKLPLGEANYYKIRSTLPSLLNPAERAARFIYLNRFCFNGLYRTNQKGEFNVPYGGAKTGSLPSIEDLKLYSEALKNTTLIACDFRQALKRTKKGDFVFLDPPYTTTQKRIFTEYGPQSFSEQDFIELITWLDIMTEKDIGFVMTYEDTPEARSIISEYHAEKISVRRNIAGNASKRKNASEWLISNIHLLA